MKTLIWKLKFALRMKRVAKTSLGFGWEAACGWVESFGIEDDPYEAVDEDISNWSE